MQEIVKQKNQITWKEPDFLYVGLFLFRIIDNENRIGILELYLFKC